MDITHHPGADALELRLTGRLDATWADHVDDTIEAAVRAGPHRIVLNFAAVSYISSLGIAVLLKHYKRLLTVSGSLTVSNPSTQTLSVFHAAKLTDFFIVDRAAVTAAATVSRSITRGAAIYQAYPQ